MIFDFYGFDDNNIERHLSINVNSNFFTFSVEGKIDKAVETEKIIQEMESYRNNYGTGVLYKERDYYKHFLELTDSVCYENMIRAFCVSSAYLHWRANDIDKDFWEKYRMDTVNKYFSNNLLIDWSGDMNEQPQMYFISRDLFSDPAIEKMYKKGILQKLVVKSCKKLQESYYLPFKYDEDAARNDLETIDCWKKIVKGVNTRILKMTGGK